ncbi:MAG: S41 family peptidase [Planctomycetes bacterium]|nr:S41 family peptidase [Planctomycetota bacterium]
MASALLRLRWLSLFLLACLSATGGFVAVPKAAAQSAARAEDDRLAVQTGARLERGRRWLDAIEHYEKTLRRWPDNQQLRYGLRRSKIHFSIDRRYSDRSFETSLLPLSRHAALDRFDEVLYQVKLSYVEPVSSTSFVAHGTESLYLALADEKFERANLQGVDAERVQKLRAVLREKYWNKPVSDRGNARRTVEEICDLSAATVGLSPGAVVMEYIFGGCNALDDYSAVLTPDRLTDLHGNIDGEFVGLGIEMKAEEGRGMLLVNVLPESPAAEGGLRRGDHIVRVDGIDCRWMTTDEAARLLRGRSGSTVRLEFEQATGERTARNTFTRRAVQVKSVPVARMIDRERGIGYVQMTGFQRTTTEELDAALRDLQRQGMRSLIWDLRGNPGGLLPVAAEVADRFVGEGLVVSTRGRSNEQNETFSAHAAGTWRVPLVLLVDEDSASASEIVAGAIRDHRRGTIVGRRTYGKWSVQTIMPLRGGTGLRLTTARFYSPSGRWLGKVGVEPDVAVELPDEHQTFYRGTGEVDLETDRDLQKALDLLRRQAA